MSTSELVTQGGIDKAEIGARTALFAAATDLAQRSHGQADPHAAAALLQAAAAAMAAAMTHKGPAARPESDASGKRGKKTGNEAAAPGAGGDRSAREAGKPFYARGGPYDLAQKAGRRDSDAPGENGQRRRQSSDAGRAVEPRRELLG